MGAEPGAHDEAVPVFLHTGPCEGPDPAAGHPFAETGALRAFRRYTGEDRSGWGIIRVPDDPARAQEAVDQALRAAFPSPEVALVHVRAVECGCFLYEVRRP
ncbi:hypothetical protein GCM10010347_65660 [Streptomyces cirratus]|uniref:DUF1203 domain-containing protein n=1 Tax=Streptomyces cirratus TaxID=68187 RepID=A0ABQ3F5K7_9ACTN|nr:DUF1203 domain-containing protein [Streptomyces cirratus]GHB85560.1 hypothetical protein GCM10010347_65660 [Streptomyces cirratus]